MKLANGRVWIGVLIVAGLMTSPAWSQIRRGEPAPDIRAVDISGEQVDLDAIISGNPYLLVLFCFTSNTGEELAGKLQSLQTQYGRDKFQVVALGVDQDVEALKTFAQRLGIRYHVISADSIEERDWLDSVSQYPMTLFVETTELRRIDRVQVGEGASIAAVLTQYAETLFRQRREDEALEVVDAALAEAPDPETQELRGYILASAGRLDEAEQEFGQINSMTGLARVSLDRGEFEKAAELAEQTGDTYALAIKADALAMLGRVDEAARALENAPVDDMDQPWQASEVINSRGRVKHHLGDVDGAIEDYRTAREIDAYGIKPLSNEAAAQREQGNLEEAEKLLVQASNRGEDALVSMLLQQVRQEMEAANNLQRQELIRSQIASLSERYRELRESGLDKPADPWSTRPLTLALLPGSGRGGVFFERAGTETALQREIETQLQADARVQVLERAMLEYLLQELELGSSDLANPNTQQTLGRVLAAQYLGFIEYAQVGSATNLYLRLVNTETTEIHTQLSLAVDNRDLGATARQIAHRVLDSTAENRKLKGLVAHVAEDDTIMINIGRIHGVSAGQEYAVFTDGDPIEVGGRVIAHSQKPVGRIKVVTVEDEYAMAEIVAVRDGAVIEKEMKIEILNPPGQA